MIARAKMDGDVTLHLSADEAATLLAEQRILRDNAGEEFGAMSDNLIDQLDSVVDDLEDEEEEEDEDDEEIEGLDESADDVEGIE